MNAFDVETIHLLNQFSHHSQLFDKIIIYLSKNSLLKFGMFATIIWWLWFREGDRHSRAREYIISSLFTAISAILFSRFLQLILPFRVKPMQEESLNFVVPYGGEVGEMSAWSSFPSDHAVLSFTLCTCLFFVSKIAGIFSILYTLFIICLPRVYLGFHYPTDILAGAALGIVAGILGNFYFVNKKYIPTIINWSMLKPSVFYPIFFLFTFQLTELFTTSRAIGFGVLKVFKSLIL